MDPQIQGLPHSAVQEHDHIRKQAVQKLIHEFENHPNKKALQADLQQDSAFNPFSEQSKEMIYSMGNVEYFKTCEITPNLQCPNYGVVVVGWLGRASTIHQCTPICHTQAQETP